MGQGGTASLKLASELDITAAAPLAAELVGLRGNDLSVDASGVVRVGGQCLQVLLSAAATWEADGTKLELVEPSEDFLTALRTVGLDIAQFSTRG